MRANKNIVSIIEGMVDYLFETEAEDYETFKADNEEQGFGDRILPPGEDVLSMHVYYDATKIQEWIESGCNLPLHPSTKQHIWNMVDYVFSNAHDDAGDDDRLPTMKHWLDRH